MDERGALSQLAANCFANSVFGALFLATPAFDMLLQSTTFDEVIAPGGAGYELELQNVIGSNVPGGLDPTNIAVAEVRERRWQGGQLDFAKWFQENVVNVLRLQDGRVRLQMTRSLPSGTPRSKDEPLYLDEAILGAFKLFLDNEPDRDIAEDTLIPQELRICGPQDAAIFLNWFFGLLPQSPHVLTTLQTWEWRERYNGAVALEIPRAIQFLSIVPLTIAFPYIPYGTTMAYDVHNASHTLLHHMQRTFALQTPDLDPSTNKARDNPIVRVKQVIASKPWALAFSANRVHAEVRGRGRTAQVTQSYSPMPLYPAQTFTLAELSQSDVGTPLGDAFAIRDIGLNDRYMLVSVLAFSPPGHYEVFVKDYNRTWWRVDATSKRQLGTDWAKILHGEPGSIALNPLYNGVVWVYEHWNWHESRTTGKMVTAHFRSWPQWGV